MSVIHKPSSDKSAQELLNMVIGYLDKKADDVNEEFAENIAMRFITNLLGVTVLRELSFRPDEKLNKEEMQAFVTDNFARLKFKVQDSVAAGFQYALETYTGKSIEYYCQIRAIPSPPTDKVC